MGVNLGIKTTFSAVDKFNSVVRKMTVGLKSFANKAVTAFNRVERAERKLRKGISNSIGMFGKLGLAVSGLAIATQIATANIELDKNMASLYAVTGVTKEQFKDFGIEIEKVSKKQKKFAGETAKAFELVGSAKPDLLASARGLSEVTTNAITLSKASGDDLESSVANLTNVLNQFELGANESANAMNVLAHASIIGDTRISQTSEAFKVAGSEANMSGLNIKELSATIALFSKYGFKGAEAGTKLRNILSKMSLGEALPKKAIDRLKEARVDIGLISDKTKPYIDRLRELSKIQNNSAALAKVFNEENKGVAAILLKNVNALDKSISSFDKTTAAVDMASKKTNTLSNLWDELIASFKNAVTSTNSENKALIVLKNTLRWVADNMQTFINVAAIGLGIFVAYKTAMLAFKGVMIAYNVIQGIATAAQWAFNTSMWANPITWIVAIILILIAVIALLIIYWEDIVEWVKTSDSWFAKLIRFAIYPLIRLFKVLGSVFDWISAKFSELTNWLKTSNHWFAKLLRGIIEFTVKAIQWFSNFMDKALKPIKKFFSDIGDAIGGIVDFFSSETQKEMGVNVNKKVNTDETINPDATKVEAEKSIQEKVFAKLGIDINDKTGNANISKNTGGIPINLTKTLGWQ